VACTQLFGFFISEKAPILLPGAPFFWSSVLMLVALAIAIPALKRIRPLV
jgi:hypothetical protein